MAYEIPGTTLGTKLAGADLSSSQYCAVKLDPTTDGFILCAAAGEQAMGILQNKPKSGQAATVMIAGTTKAVAGATIAINDPVAVDAAGKLRTATSGQAVVGRALMAAVANDVFSVQLNTQQGVA